MITVEAVWLLAAAILPQALYSCLPQPTADPCGCVGGCTFAAVEAPHPADKEDLLRCMLGRD